MADDLSAVPPEAGHPPSTRVEVRALGPARPAEDAVTIDRESLKLLASDTRLDILKALKARRMTVSELSATLKLGKSTVFEHVTKLVDGEWVVRHEDPAREWVYYELSPKAKRLLQPSATRIVLMFSSVIAIAAAAALVFLLASPTHAVPPIAASVEEDVFLAGAESLVKVRVATEAGIPVADARLYLLTPDAAARIRNEEALPDSGAIPLLPIPRDSPDAGVPSGDSGEPGTYVARAAFEPGTYYLYAKDASTAADGRHAMPRVLAVPAHASIAPTPLLVGADDGRPIDVRLAGLGAPLANALLTLNDTRVATLHEDASTSRAGNATLRLVLRDAGNLTLKYRPAGNLTLAVPAAGHAPVHFADLALSRGGLVAGAENALTVIVHHPERGLVEGARVSLRDGARTLAEDTTDARGQAHLLVRPGAPSVLALHVGEWNARTLLATRALTARIDPVAPAPGAPIHLTLIDPASGDAVPGARITLGANEAEAVADANGNATLTAPAAPGPRALVVNADGFPVYATMIAVGGEAPPPIVGSSAGAPDWRAYSDARGTTAAVRLGEPATYHASVTNNASARAVHAVEVRVNGDPYLRQMVALEPGEHAVLAFPLHLPPGTHEVTADGSPPLRVTVMSEPDAFGFGSGSSSSGAPLSERPPAAVPAPPAALLVGVLALAARLLARRARH